MGKRQTSLISNVYEVTDRPAIGSGHRIVLADDPTDAHGTSLTMTLTGGHGNDVPACSHCRRHLRHSGKRRQVAPSPGSRTSAACVSAPNDEPTSTKPSSAWPAP